MWANPCILSKRSFPCPCFVLFSNRSIWHTGDVYHLGIPDGCREMTQGRFRFGNLEGLSFCFCHREATETLNKHELLRVWVIFVYLLRVYRRALALVSSRMITLQRAVLAFSVHGRNITFLHWICHCKAVIPVRLENTQHWRQIEAWTSRMKLQPLSLDLKREATSVYTLTTRRPRRQRRFVI